jgi:hypothetical protein
MHRFERSLAADMDEPEQRRQRSADRPFAYVLPMRLIGRVELPPLPIRFRIRV